MAAVSVKRPIEKTTSTNFVFPSYSFGCAVPRTSNAVLITLKRSLRAARQDHHTFQILSLQLQKKRKEMAPQEHQAAKLRPGRQLMEL